MKLLTTLVFVLNIYLVQGQIMFQNQASARGVGDTCGTINLGGGISFFDYNNDGWDDITFATQDSDNIKIYKNIQNGFFILETSLSLNNTYQHKQPVWVDYDNDGDFDLYLTSDTDGNRLYMNTGASLIDVTNVSGLPVPNILTYGASWGDYNNDSYLDVFISNRDPNLLIPNYLFKNNGDGTFTNVSELAGIGSGSHLSFCSAFFDYNNDGWQDIYVANDKTETQNLLYHNNGDGTFTEVGELSGTNVSIDAMSTTIGDYNNDGWFDIYVTNGPDGNVLFKNNSDGTFADEALASGTIFNSAGWGSVFLDAENDGDLDLYVSGALDGSSPDLLSAAFYENQSDGTFSTLNNGSFNNDNLESYANAMGDIDNDGYPEIIVSNSNNGDLFLWKNNSSQSNNWLKVKLEGTISNRQGVGSTIEISLDGQKQYRYTLCGEGYLGQNSSYEFFGLGQSTTVDYVKVTWLSGIEDIIYNVDSNQSITILENATLSLSDDVKHKVLKIFPNPVRNKLHIVSQNEIIVLELYNVLGHKIYTSRINVREYTFDVNFLSEGIYFLNLTTAYNSIKNYKIVKH